MCGLWASIGLPELPLALDLAAHRGPDGGRWQCWSGRHGEIRLAHRRLAVQDRHPRSDQPFCDRSQRRWLSFNGEILNHSQLRADLLREGARFDTGGDTEVLLALLERQGLAGLERIRGFFAFLLVDLRRQCLLAARDRYGIKPLYLTGSAPGAARPWLAFASEIKQFTAVPGAVKGVDPSALRDYLTWGLFDHTDRTFFDGVRQLAPGHALEIDLNRPPDQTPSLVCWAPALRPASATREPTACADMLRDALDEAVRLNLQSDAEPALTLSGGLDSSSICARACVQAPPERLPFQAFGVMFDDAQSCEREHAVAVARHCAIDLRTVSLERRQLTECFERVLWHFDEPVVVPNMLAQHAVFELIASRGLRVVLTGQGGDELLCGYPAMYGVALLDIARSDGTWAALRELHSVLRAGVAPAALARSAFSQLTSKALLQLAGRGFAARAPRWQQRLAACIDPLVARGALAADQPVQPAGALAALGHALMRGGNLRMLLHFEDRNSMAFGIESRPVMVDADIESVCLGMPATLKLRDGRSKWMLREAMRASLPASVIERRDKLGFPVPEHLWREGEFHGWLCEHARVALHECRVLLDDLLDLPQVESRLRSRQTRGLPLWALAGLGAWLQRFGVRGA